MIADSHKQIKAALLAKINFEEAYDSAKFAMHDVLPNASQEMINELLSSLVDLVLCSLKNQIVNGEENESSSH
jgi:hypothetical protein